MYFSVLFGVIAVAVGWSVYVWVSNEFEERQASYVSDMRDALLTVARNNGFDALKSVVARKSGISPEAGIVYLLCDEAGGFVAGNINPIPWFEGTRFVPWSNVELRNPWIEDAIPTGITAEWSAVEGGRLLVGDDDADIVEAQRVLFEGITFGSATIAIIAGITGCFLGLRAQRRINSISEALDAAGRGQPHLRVVRTRSGDDIDCIGSHVNSTLDQLQRVLESLRQVSADIAHDLKTPIGRIQRRLEGVNDTETDVAGYRDCVATTLGEIEGVVETFEALLSIAQLEAGLKKQRFRQVDVRGVVASLADDYRLVAEEYGDKLEFEDRGGAPVLGDSELLTQLFANLIENSIRHCPRGSRINLKLHEAESGVVVEIADTGPGIPQAEREKVFRRLYRLEKSRTTPGHGLGLSLVSAIVRLHDGTIELGDNNPGLTVTVTFPKAAGRELSLAEVKTTSASQMETAAVGQE